MSRNENLLTDRNYRVSERSKKRIERRIRAGKLLEEMRTTETPHKNEVEIIPNVAPVDASLDIGNFATEPSSPTKLKPKFG